MLLGSVEACVVGLSHLFRTAADSNGVRLKKLAAYLGKFSGNICGMTKIILRREKNILSDPNAVSVVVPNPANPKGGKIQNLDDMETYSYAYVIHFLQTVVPLGPLDCQSFL